METTSSASTWSVFERLTREQFSEFQQAGLSFLHAQLLYNRGLRTPDAMLAFLEARYDSIPDPLLLIDMDRAVARITHALAHHEAITIYSDFDADGVTSAALITRALRALKSPETRLDCYIPSRLHDTRGLSKEALNTIAGRGSTLIITTDCGSSDVEEVAYAQSLGIDIIITDHHHPPERLPQAYAMINPWRPDCTYGERYLCGVGIAFKLALALFHTQEREQEAHTLLDLVAIGTVGDVAQLLGENHILVREGLKRLNQTQNPGLQALISLARLTPGRIHARDISYALAPRINAAGRMKDARIAFILLTTDDPQEALALAQELEGLNLLRQRQTEELMKLVREQAQQQTDNQVLLVYGDKETWPEGIIGLVAGKLSEEVKRPVFVLSQDIESSRGSARSQEGFNIISALRAARPDLFERYGGHAQAAGFTIANANIAELHEHLLKWYKRSLAPGEAVLVEQVEEEEVGAGASGGTTTGERGNPEGVVVEQEITPSTGSRKADMVLSRPELLNLETLAKIEQISPFGAGNPEPAFRLDGARLARRWASGVDGRHLRVRLRINGLQFNGTFLRGGDRVKTLREGALVRIIFCLEPALNSSDSEDVWLKILHIETLE